MKHISKLDLFQGLYFPHPHPRLKTCSWPSPRRRQLSTAGLRTQRRIWQIQWGATLWRRSGRCVKPMKPSAPRWAPRRPTSTSWPSWTSRSRATRWRPTPTPGSLWRPWRRPGGTYRRSSRSPHQRFYSQIQSTDTFNHLVLKGTIIAHPCNVQIELFFLPIDF